MIRESLISLTLRTLIVSYLHCFQVSPTVKVLNLNLHLIEQTDLFLYLLHLEGMFLNGTRTLVLQILQLCSVDVLRLRC